MLNGSIVEVKNLSKSYGDRNKKVVALDSISLSITSNSRVAIMGSSGSGKSTLLQLIGGLDKPTAGSVVVDNKNVHQYNDTQLSVYRNQSIGFIFQAFNLQSHLNAWENVALPLILSGVHSLQAKEEAIAYLEKVNLGDQMNKFPSQLSGGEMQRVAIARALVRRPSIILADEPTANLDKANAENILSILLNLNLDQQAVVIVTHDERIAKQFDRLIELDHGVIINDVNLIQNGATAEVR